MKKFLQVALLALLAVGTQSCNDALDRISDSPSFDTDLVAPTPGGENDTQPRGGTIQP